MAVLEGSRHQAKIEIARDIARRIALRDGRVNSRQVRQVLAEQGLLNSSERELWIGAIFKPSLWEATGDEYVYSDRERNIHSRKVTWWRLRSSPLPTTRSRKEGASGSDVAPTSSDKRTRPPEKEPEAPVARLPASSRQLEFYEVKSW